QLREGLRLYMNSRENAAWATKLYQLLPKLPVMSYAIFSRYVMMVHNTLTGQQLGMDALNSALPPEGGATPVRTEQRDRNSVYLAERAMLQVVRNGDISYQSILQNSVGLSPGVPIQGQDPLRQMKTSIVVFTTLVSRAAIEGGLSPEVAYPLGDSYIQSAEDCRDSGELSALAFAMYHDFIYRVHHLRTNPNYSLAIQKCCDYIELSLDRKIRVSDLAALVGYTEYYLTDKFKKETGQSINSYIRFVKVERAKVLLTSTDTPVKEIAESLAFNTVNYFIQSFRETTGYSPAQYRKKFR
ncbi:MAG: helix-turn-helix domain-containing protein, partial [Oscillospiraceae bacterium]|nr:helix-turn-helix domain-containing protein [Oscillospiraceae bacterium]